MKHPVLKQDRIALERILEDYGAHAVTRELAKLAGEQSAQFLAYDLSALLEWGRASDVLKEAADKLESVA